MSHASYNSQQAIGDFHKDAEVADLDHIVAIEVTGRIAATVALHKDLVVGVVGGAIVVEVRITVIAKSVAIAVDLARVPVIDAVVDGIADTISVSVPVSNHCRVRIRKAFRSGQTRGTGRAAELQAEDAEITNANDLIEAPLSSSTRLRNESVGGVCRYLEDGRLDID